MQIEFDRNVPNINGTRRACFAVTFRHNIEERSTLDSGRICMNKTARQLEVSATSDDIPWNVSPKESLTSFQAEL